MPQYLTVAIYHTDYPFLLDRLFNSGCRIFVTEDRRTPIPLHKRTTVESLLRLKTDFPSSRPFSTLNRLMDRIIRRMKIHVLRRSSPPRLRSLKIREILTRWSNRRISGYLCQYKRKDTLHLLLSSFARFPLSLAETRCQLSEKRSIGDKYRCA